MEVIAKDETGNERVIKVGPGPQLYSGLTISFDTVFKEDNDRQESRQAEVKGNIAWPFKIRELYKFQILNQYHSTCLHAKKNCTVGLGFMSEAEIDGGVTAVGQSMAMTPTTSNEEQFTNAALNPFYMESEIDKELNKYCRTSWSDVLLSAGEDYYQSGNGFIEVVRQQYSRTTTSGGGASSRTNRGDILGIYHVNPCNVTAAVTDSKFLYWKVRDSYSSTSVVPSLTNGPQQSWAPFGKWEQFKNDPNLSAKQKGSDKNISEMIHFRKPSSNHSILGYPDWFAAIHPMELISAMTQFKYNFFNNRGVPEFMLFVKGRVSDEQWTKIEAAVQGHIGKFNSHKTFAVNFDDENIEVQVEKLGMDAKTDTGMFKDKESLQADIVTAHRMPPLLGNILIPGKLGASNEFPNALMSFQTLTISQEQRIFEQTLKRTLANDEVNGNLTLTENNVILRKITDLINIGQADTVSRMRETVVEAEANGRDLGDGLRD